MWRFQPNIPRIALFPLYFALFDAEFSFFYLLEIAKNWFVCYFLEFQVDYESEVKFEFSTFLSNWESNSRSKTWNSKNRVLVQKNAGPPNWKFSFSESPCRNEHVETKIRPWLEKNPGSHCKHPCNTNERGMSDLE